MGWIYKYHGIGLAFEDRVVRIKNDDALRAFLKADPKAEYRLAEFIRKAYEYKYRKPLKISRDSLAKEIRGHYRIQKAVFEKDGIWEKLHINDPTAARSIWLLDHMDVIDCGEKALDNNRFVWDFMAGEYGEHITPGLKIREYKVPEFPFGSLRAALVADLHDRNPEAVLDALLEQKPDLILVAGDLMERHEEGMSPWTVDDMSAWQGIPSSHYRFTRMIKRLDGSMPGKESGRKWNTNNGLRFLKQASKIAPVVESVGNHEWYFTDRDYACMKENGVILLDNQDVELNLGGCKLRLGGFSTRYDVEWLQQFGEKDGYKILLCHHPDYYFRHIQGNKWDTFDLVLAGHAHGGQWRVGSRGGEKPGISVYAPGQGVAPKYAYGRHGKLIITAGVANTAPVPRFGNPTELVMLHLGEEKD